jgi:hypothetical protein
MSIVNHRLLERLSPITSPRAPRGQALIETLVVSAVLVPLVLISVLLGKYQSLQTASIAAARTLAFECTVRRDECSEASGLQKLSQEIAQRHLSRTSREVFSEDQVPDLKTGAERHALWTNRRGEGLLESFADTAAVVSPGSFDAGVGVANGFERTGQVPGAVNLLSNLAGPGKFGLSIRDGLLTARVQVKVGSSRPDFSVTRSWLDGLPLQFNARAAILVDDWSASKPQGSEASTVETRVNQGKRLSAPLETAQDAAYLAVRASIALMGAIGLDRSGSSFQYHSMDMDVVPADRLGAPGVVTAPPPEELSGPGIY